MGGASGPGASLLLLWRVLFKSTSSWGQGLEMGFFGPGVEPAHQMFPGGLLGAAGIEIHSSGAGVGVEHCVQMAVKVTDRSLTLCTSRELNSEQ